MSKEIYISSTPHETRLAIVENDALAEIYYERENEYTLAGSIYNGKVTRVLPGMQSSFVDIGLERDAFLYITDFMEEAGDSADFDTNGDSSQRAPRREGRGDRSGNREPQTIEAVPADDSSRSSRGDRDRGGRGRRGRGDRSGNRDRQPGTEYVQPVEGQDAYAADFNRTDEFVLRPQKPHLPSARMFRTLAKERRAPMAVAAGVAVVAAVVVVVARASNPSRRLAWMFR